MGKPLTWAQRWIVSEILSEQSFKKATTVFEAAESLYPIAAVIGTALGLCGFCMARNLSINPDVRINKDDRGAGVLENYKEGKAYKDHGFRKFLSTQKRTVMPGFNEYFGGAKKR